MELIEDMIKENLDGIGELLKEGVKDEDGSYWHHYRDVIRYCIEEAMMSVVNRCAEVAETGCDSANNVVVDQDSIKAVKLEIR